MGLLYPVLKPYEMFSVFYEGAHCNTVTTYPGIEYVDILRRVNC